MNSKISDKITSQTTQFLANGQVVYLTLSYPANFKINDLIEVTASKTVMQSLHPQHEEGFFVFDIEVWDDRFRLSCDSINELETNADGQTVFSLKIREIDLFADASFTAQKSWSYN